MSIDDDFPGRRLGVVGLVLALTVSVVGIVVSVVALITSARARRRNVPAVAGVIFGALGTLVFLAALWFIVQFFAGNIGPCAELGPGTHTDGLATYECGSA